MQLLTRKDIADFLGVKPFQVRRWEKAGKITPVLHVSGRYPRYTIEELNKVAIDKQPMNNTAKLQTNGE